MMWRWYTRAKDLLEKCREICFSSCVPVFLFFIDAGTYRVKRNYTFLKKYLNHFKHCLHGSICCTEAYSPWWKVYKLRLHQGVKTSSNGFIILVCVLWGLIYYIAVSYRGFLLRRDSELKKKRKEKSYS